MYTCACFNRLQVGELLGEGAFGKVYKGYVHGNDSSVEPSVMAVKMLKGIFCLMHARSSMHSCSDNYYVMR